MKNKTYHTESYERAWRRGCLKISWGTDDPKKTSLFIITKFFVQYYSFSNWGVNKAQKMERQGYPQILEFPPFPVQVKKDSLIRAYFKPALWPILSRIKFSKVALWSKSHPLSSIMTSCLSFTESPWIYSLKLSLPSCLYIRDSTNLELVSMEMFVKWIWHERDKNKWCCLYLFILYFIPLVGN